MRRKRKKRDVLTVSLFPFLAVLICTLGALIVLLVLAVKAAEHDAQQANEQQQQVDQEQIDQLQSQLDLELIRIEGLEQVRPETISELDNAKSIRGHLESEMRRMKDTAVQLARRLQRLEQPDEEIELASLEREQSELSASLESAREKLANARSRKAQLPEKVTYSIVPHSGTGGTFRRPIYVECAENEVILQPLGIKLTSQDFLSAGKAGNPLDAALLAIRDYWNRVDQDNQHGKPYPLLIIRPEGANAYAAARRAMNSWDDEFGYELVESEKELDYGPADPALKTEVLRALADARRQLARMAAVRKRNYGRRPSSAPSGLVASGSQGGFVAHQSGDFENQGSGFESASTGGKNATSQNANNQRNKVADQRQQDGREPGQNAGFAGQPGGTAAAGDTMPSIADQRGQNWALPARTAGGTGYVRPIRVYCAADQLVIESARQRVTLPIDESIESTIDPLVDEIWKMIDRWGVAAAGGYWKPQLRTTVVPGGELHFERLSRLLDRSGLDVQEVQTR